MSKSKTHTNLKTSTNSKLQPKLNVAKNSGTKKKDSIQVQSKKLKLIAPKKTKGLIQDIVSTGVDIADTVVTTMSNPVEGLLKKLPATILKSVDTIQGIQRAFDPKTKDSNFLDLSGQVLPGSKDERLIEVIKNEIPVISTTLVPQAYASELKAPPVKTTQTTYKGVTCTRFSGTVVLGSARAVTGTGETHVQRNERGWINPQTLALGPILVQQTAYFSKFLPVSITLHYTPFCSTAESGSVILSFFAGVSNNTTLPTDITSLSQREHLIIIPANRPGTLSLSGKFSARYMYPSFDTRFSADWTFETFVSGRGLGFNPVAFGWISMTYDFLCFNRMDSIVIGSKFSNHCLFLGAHLNSDLANTISVLNTLVYRMTLRQNERSSIEDQESEKDKDYYKCKLSVLSSVFKSDWNLTNITQLYEYLIDLGGFKTSDSSKMLIDEIIRIIYHERDYITYTMLSNPDVDPIITFLTTFVAVVEEHNKSISNPFEDEDFLFGLNL